MAHATLYIRKVKPEVARKFKVLAMEAGLTLARMLEKLLSK